jgi:hypothetical protein
MRVVVIFIALAASLFGGLSGCKRPCESQSNCERTCTCVNSDTQASFDCTIAYLCDGSTATCENDYSNQSCNDMCNQYAAHGECGFERCNADADCTKDLTCPKLDANGQPTTLNFDCKLTFACDQAQHLCAAASTQSQDQLCATCDQQAATGG